MMAAILVHERAVHQKGCHFHGMQTCKTEVVHHLQAVKLASVLTARYLALLHNLQGRRTWYGQYGHGHVGFFKFTVLRMR